MWTQVRCAALCQKKQSFPVQSLHHRCDLIYSYGVSLIPDTITVLSNALLVAILPQKSDSSAQLWSCSAVTMPRNFPILIRIDNTLTHSPTPTSCPGIADICWWGPPGAALTYNCTPLRSRILPTASQGHPHVAFGWNQGWAEGSRAGAWWCCAPSCTPEEPDHSQFSARMQAWWGSAAAA